MRRVFLLAGVRRVSAGLRLPWSNARNLLLGREELFQNGEHFIDQSDCIWLHRVQTPVSHSWYTVQSMKRVVAAHEVCVAHRCPVSMDEAGRPVIVLVIDVLGATVRRQFSQVAARPMADAEVQELLPYDFVGYRVNRRLVQKV